MSWFGQRTDYTRSSVCSDEIADTPPMKRAPGRRPVSVNDCIDRAGINTGPAVGTGFGNPVNLSRFDNGTNRAGFNTGPAGNTVFVYFHDFQLSKGSSLTPQPDPLAPIRTSGAGLQHLAEIRSPSDPFLSLRSPDPHARYSHRSDPGFLFRRAYGHLQ